MSLYHDKIDGIMLSISSGMSIPEIMLEYDVPRSTLYKWIRRYKGLSSTTRTEKQPNKRPTGVIRDHSVFAKKHGLPRVLLLDIETAPVLAYVWRLFKENVGLNQINEDWHLLSFSALWLGDSIDDLIYDDQRNEPDITNDDRLLKRLWELLDEADIVITQNGKKFDVPKIRARMVIREFKPFSPVRHIDLLDIAKRTFGFTSNRLAYTSEVLCPEIAKLSHEKYPGFELWKECMAGNMDAWNEMELYNRQDVVSLLGIYEKMSPWSDRLPSFAVYTSENRFICACGSHNVVRKGYFSTDVSKFPLYVCVDCGHHYRGRKSIHPKAKRETLLVSAREN